MRKDHFLLGYLYRDTEISDWDGTSDEWQRLIPTSWNIFPLAFHTAMMYASFHFPPPGDPYNPIQQLSYFGVVFLLGPFMIATGAAMSPAIDARFPWYPKMFRGRQVARSLHFLGMIAFVLFIVVHLTIVTIERFPENMGNIALGQGKYTSLGVAIALFSLFFSLADCTSEIKLIINSFLLKIKSIALFAPKITNAVCEGSTISSISVRTILPSISCIANILLLLLVNECNYG